MTILPFDEINSLESRLSVHFEDGVEGEDGKKGRIKSRKDREEIEDELLDLFVLAYASGVNATNAELGTTQSPSVEDVNKAVYADVAGENWKERVEKYFETGGTLYDIRRIAETDAIRIYNQGALDAVTANGITNANKRWVTMMDDRVRDTHDYLEGMVVPFNQEFYTYDGDHAAAPGLFQKAENNVNCRCVIEVIRG